MKCCSLALFSIAEQSQLQNVTVSYLTMPGWKTTTSHLKTFPELPLQAQCYVKKLEELLEVPSE